MSSEVKISVIAGAQGNPGAPMQGLADATRNAAQEEQKYQQNLSKTVQGLHEKKRMAEDLFRMGEGPDTFSGPGGAERKYEQSLRDKINSVAAQKRMAQDLFEAGHGPDPFHGPGGQERKFQQDVRDQIAANARQKRMAQELYERGEGPKPGGTFTDKLTKFAQNPLATAGGAYGALAIAGIKLTEAGLDGLAKGFNALHDPLLSTAQRMEAFREGIPIIGGTMRAWRELIEAVDGTTATLISNVHQLAEARAWSAQRATVHQTFFAGEAEQTGLKARAESSRIASNLLSIRLPDAAARTVGGVRAFETAERLMPHERARLSGMANVGALGEQESYARDDVLQQKREHDRLSKIAEAKGRKLEWLSESEDKTGTRNKEGIDTAAKEYLDTLNKAREQGNRALEAEGRLRDVVNQKAQAGAAVRQAEIATLQTRIALGKEEIGRQANQLQSFGGMMPGDQMFALNSAQRFKQHGFKGIMPEERNVLRQAGFGEVLDMEALKAGEKDPRNQQLRQLMGLGKADLAGEQKKVAAMQVEADVKVGLNEALLAEELAKKLGPIIKEVIALTEKKARQNLDENWAGQVQQRNQRQ